MTDLPAAAPFYKASGAGNDFVLLPVPSAELASAVPTAGQIRAWCTRGLSIGADGVITLAPAGAGVRMAHWNSDGGRSDLCLNGSRCAARLAFELGWSTGDQLTLDTDVGPLQCRRSPDGVISLGLPPAMAGEPAALTLTVDGQSYAGHLVRVGVPHFVLPWDDLAHVPILRLGAALRWHADLGEGGANVDFVRARGGRLELRTFERGVEGETLACGTGAVASALAGVATGQLAWPVVAQTAGGFELTIDREPAGGLRLAGDARLIYRGEMLAGAEDLPEPPAWSPVAP